MYQSVNIFDGHRPYFRLFAVWRQELRESLCAGRN